MSSVPARFMVSRASESQLLTRLNGKVGMMSAAGICHKDRMDPVAVAVKPKPWPYREKQIKNWRFWLTGESTTDRFDENTVMVTIEGLPGSGKSALAKKLAEMTNMYHQPKANFDFVYIRPDGLDYRIFNKVYFPQAQYPDLDMFFQNPKHPKMGRMQLLLYKLRFFHYLEAMIHLFNTGQGVIMERTPWSDQVFAEAMHKCGYLNDETWRFYTIVRHNTQIKIWRPHLVIYIDTPVETAMKNIKKRNNPNEVNSPIWNTDFIKHIDEGYKERILPQYDEHSHVVIYPYKDELDADSILQDLEKIDLQVCLSSVKLCDWRLGDENEWNDWRLTYTNEIEMWMAKFNLPTWDVEDFDYSSEAKEIHLQTETALAPGYWPNFDPDRHSVWNLAFKRDNNYWQDRAMNLFKAYTP